MNKPTQRGTKPSVPAETETETKSTALVETPPDFGGEAGAGFENMSADDYAIPFLQILQGLSPQVKRSDGAYIEGAQEGMLVNTVTRELIDTENRRLVVIPAAYRHTWVEWRVREKGGGFVREHTAQPNVETKRDDKSREIMPNGNQLNDTRTFYVLVLDEATGVTTPAVLSMTSTQIKKAKQWVMQQNLLKLVGANGPYTPPMFASKWLVTTVPESNEKGSWYGWKFEHAGYLKGPQDPTFIAARDFHKAVSSGEVKADMSKSTDDTEGAGKGGKGGGYVDPETGEYVGGSDASF